MTIERIDQRLAALRAEGRTALVIYLTIGDPSVEDSVACALAAARAGADVLELGVPFSDPTAD
ncbi:MAG TPA: tryptophan synthase subunit alpha, partial [Polyangiaceae bacterium]